MDAKLQRLLNGERVIVSSDWLDAHTDYEIRTAYNQRRCGLLDAYVAWIGDAATPPDIEYKETVCGRLAFATA